MPIEILLASALVLGVMNPSAAYPACFKLAGRHHRQIRGALDLVDREGCFHRPRPHGRAMARPLLDADHDTLIYNRTPETLAVLAGRGAKVAGSIAEAAAQGVVIAMLADDAALAQVAEGAGGLIESLPEGGIHVAMGAHRTMRSAP